MDRRARVKAQDEGDTISGAKRQGHYSPVCEKGPKRTPEAPTFACLKHIFCILGP